MRPSACAGLGDDAVAGGVEGWEEVEWDEVRDENIALVVVGRFEGGLGDAHGIDGEWNKERLSCFGTFPAGGAHD